MTDLTYRDLGLYENGFSHILQTHFGAHGHAVGNDYVIPHATVERMLSKDVFKLHRQITITGGDDATIAQELASQIPRHLEKYRPSPPPSLHLSGNYGLLSEVEEAVARLTIEPADGVKDIFACSILPLMRTRFNAQYVTGISLNINRQQAWISLSKIVTLASHFPRPKVQELMDRGAMDGILPKAINALSFIDALTRFSPIMLTLPIHRDECAWHFQTSGMWTVPNAPANGIVPEFIRLLNPLSDEVHQLGLVGLTGMSEKNIWKFLRFIVVGMNRLLRFLNDSREFSDHSGMLNISRQVQAYGAVHLLFADIIGINLSTTAHNRISYALSALDKLATFECNLAIGSVTKNRWQ